MPTSYGDGQRNASQEPTAIGLTINLRTARQIGLSILNSVLVRATEVIE